ncbi:MAG: 5'/3'-nucleotidase SurE [Gemmatimonadetes bacterium]|nr:5'/3'-nucleotidase SurE [Gemmatimonadota bacterium]
MRILCTNDDGYLSPGIRVLAEAAHEIGSVDIIAPDREQSASSNALTLHSPLRARKTHDGTTIVDGTPTDCVILAVTELLDTRPDLCVSGINSGPNMGEDVLYSGTVAAAMEATLLGIPAVAFSYIGREVAELEGWQPVVSSLLKQFLARGIPAHELLNVNFPPLPPSEVRGVRVTNLGRRRYSESITRAPDPSGREYYWIGGGVTHWNGGPDSDFRAVRDGYVSVTPLHLDLTSYRRLDELREWEIHL